MKDAVPSEKVPRYISWNVTACTPQSEVSTVVALGWKGM